MKTLILAGAISASVLLSGCAVAQEQLTRPVLASDFSNETTISNADLVSCARGNKIKVGEYVLVDTYTLCPDELQSRINEGAISRDETAFDVGRSENMERKEQEQRESDQQFQQMQQQELDSDLDRLNRLNVGAMSCGLHPRLCRRGLL